MAYAKLKKSFFNLLKVLLPGKKSKLTINPASDIWKLIVSVHWNYPYVGLHLKSIYNSKFSLNPPQKTSGVV